MRISPAHSAPRECVLCMCVTLLGTICPDPIVLQQMHAQIERTCSLSQIRAPLRVCGQGGVGSDPLSCNVNLQHVMHDSLELVISLSLNVTLAYKKALVASWPS